MLKNGICFCPIHYSELTKIITDKNYVIEDEWYGIHLWNECWRRANYDKGQYKIGSMYHFFYSVFDKPKILITSTQYPSFGGAATNSYEIIKYLRKQGYHVAGIFIQAGNCIVDPDKIGGIYQCERVNMMDFYIDSKNIKALKQKIISYLGGHPTINFIKKFLSTIHL